MMESNSETEKICKVAIFTGKGNKCDVPCFRRCRTKGANAISCNHLTNFRHLDVRL